jgi:hypothetical protein
MARLALILARHIVYECILRDEYRGKVHRTIDTIRLHHVMIWKLMGSAVAVGILGISLLSEMQIRPTTFPVHILGGLMIGIGFSFIGLCSRENGRNTWTLSAERLSAC